VVLVERDLKSAVEVPSRSTYRGATLLLQIADAEYVGMWAARVLVESALDSSKLLAHLNLPVSIDQSLILSNLTREPVILPCDFEASLFYVESIYISVDYLLVRNILNIYSTYTQHIICARPING
jgi:hypothetical protein